MTFTRDGINNMHVRRLEHIARQLDARQSKVRSTATREKWVERANDAIFRSECDRIRGELPHIRRPTKDRKKLEDRVFHFDRIFSSGNV